MIRKLLDTFRVLITTTFATLLLTFWSALPAYAADFNCGAYGAGTYQNAACGTGLENTGQPVWPIIIAVLLILAGTLLLYRTRKKMKQRAATTQAAAQPKQPPQPPQPVQ